MSISYRRYEILLPRRYNDGRPVSPRLVTETLIELRKQFGAASQETQVIRGQWQHESEIYHDQLTRIFVDVEDTPDSRSVDSHLRRCRGHSRQSSILYRN